MKTFLNKFKADITWFFLILVGISLVTLFMITTREETYFPCQNGKILFAFPNKDKIVVTCQGTDNPNYFWNEVWRKGIVNWIKVRIIDIDLN